MSLSRIAPLILLASLLLLAGFSVCGAATAQVGSPQRLALKKAFLLRNADDLARTLDFAREATEALNEQVEAVGLLGYELLAQERHELQAMVRQHQEWLTIMLGDFELAMNNGFAQQSAVGIGLDRYDDLIKGFQGQADAIGRWQEKLDKNRQKLEDRIELLNTAVAQKRVLTDVADLGLARELWPDYRDRLRLYGEPVYRELTPAEISRLQSERQSLVEQQPQYAGLTEFGRYEHGWLMLKVEEFIKLRAIAAAFADSAPEGLGEAIGSTIRTYEADSLVMKRKLIELAAKIQRSPSNGSLNALEHRKALLNYYDKVKDRYDHHVAWLEGEAGSYRVELAELAREKRRQEAVAESGQSATIK